MGNTVRLAAAVLLMWGCAERAGWAQQETGDAGHALRAEMARLRQEFDALRRQYDERLAGLESRLAVLESGRTTLPAPGAAAGEPAAAGDAPAVAQAPVPAGQEVPSPAGTGGQAQGTLPVYGNVSALSKVFNPDIAVIGNFLGAAGRNAVAASPAFEMREAELSFQAIVDPFARADFFAGIEPGGGIDLEEGYLTLTSLPGGLLAKVGKLHAAFGKVNQMHSHVLPWTDRPLMNANLAGGDEGISDAGVSVSRLLPNPWLFLEATGEVYRGESEIFRTRRRSDLAYVGHLRGYRDLSEATNLDLGASFAYGHNDAVEANGTTRLVSLDATFRYRPLRRAIYRRLLARTEVTWSRRSELGHLPQSFGAYASGEYQFARRWRAGLRLDVADRATDPFVTDKGASLLLTYWPSEFSQVRGQYRRTRYGDAPQIANEFLFQFLFSIGAHGAHPF